MLACTFVDDADFDWLNQWRWSLKVGRDGRHRYAVRRVYFGGGRGAQKSMLISMHRLILGLEKGDPRQGDHINRIPLDNRRSNLRIAERGCADNGQNTGLLSNNTSGYRGVHWIKKLEKWQARATVDYKRHVLGCYATAEEADQAAKAFRAEHMPFSDDAR